MTSATAVSPPSAIIANAAHRAARLRIVLTTLLVMAAVVVLFFVAQWGASTWVTTGGLHNVDQTSPADTQPIYPGRPY
jgi:hypothetical protein